MGEPPNASLALGAVAERALRLLGHREATKQRPDCPEGPAKQTPGDKTVPGGLEMVLGTVQTVPEDLAPWGTASCSQGTFWKVCVSQRVRIALAGTQAAQIPQGQEGRRRRRR